MFRTEGNTAFHLEVSEDEDVVSPPHGHRPWERLPRAGTVTSRDGLALVWLLSRPVRHSGPGEGDEEPLELAEMRVPPLRRGFRHTEVFRAAKFRSSGARTRAAQSGSDALTCVGLREAGGGTSAGARGLSRGRPRAVRWR